MNMAQYFPPLAGKLVSFTLAGVCLALLAACGGTAEEDFATPGEKLQALCGSKATADDQRRAAMNCSGSIEVDVFFVTEEVTWETGNGTLGVGYPHMVRPNGKLEHLTNETGEQVGDCGLGAERLPEPDGRPFAACTEPLKGNLRWIYPIDPKRGALLPKLPGVSHETLKWYGIEYGTYGDTPFAQHGVVQKGSYVELPGGRVLYWDFRSAHVLRETSDNFRTNTILKVNVPHPNSPEFYPSMRIIVAYPRRSEAVR